MKAADKEEVSKEERNLTREVEQVPEQSRAPLREEAEAKSGKRKKILAERGRETKRGQIRREQGGGGERWRVE
eukprot:753800-Hanusia_phi.AAC.2